MHGLSTPRVPLCAPGPQVWALGCCCRGRGCSGHAHLGSSSGLSFLQHGHNSYQPHLLLFCTSLSAPDLFPTACVLLFPCLQTRENGYSGNKDTFTSSVLTALVSATAASHCAGTRVLFVGSQRFCGFGLVSGCGFSHGKDQEPGKAATESKSQPTEVMVLGKAVPEIQSLPTLKVPRN